MATYAFKLQRTQEKTPFVRIFYFIISVKERVMKGNRIIKNLKNSFNFFNCVSIKASMFERTMAGTGILKKEKD